MHVQNRWKSVVSSFTVPSLGWNDLEYARRKRRPLPEDYERGRPGWPRGTVELLGLPPAATVLDLGAGTGKLTRLLVSEFDRVVAVEPADAMRRLLVTLCPGAEARAGNGRAVPLPDSSVDAVFAAEAFHWFDDDRSLAEITRVLRAGGALVLMWNLPAGPWEPSIAAVEALLRERLPEGAIDYDPLDLDEPRRGDGNWRGSFAAAGFELLRDTRMPNHRCSTEKDWWPSSHRWDGSRTSQTKNDCHFLLR